LVKGCYISTGTLFHLTALHTYTILCDGRNHSTCPSSSLLWYGSKFKVLQLIQGFYVLYLMGLKIFCFSM